MNFSEKILNRSLSTPDINSFTIDKSVAGCRFNNDESLIRQQVFVEQVYHGLNPHIERHYSCEKIYGGLNVANSNIKRDYNSFLGNNEDICSNISNLRLTSNELCLEQQRNNVDDFNKVTPMEVDTSYESKADGNKLNLEKIYSNENLKYSNMVESDLKQRKEKKTFRKMKDSGLTTSETTSTSENKHTSKCQLTFLMYIMSVPIAFALYYVFIFEKNAILPLHNIERFQLEQLEHELHKEVYYQSEPLNVILNNLNQIQGNWKCNLKVLNFVGPSGVGKTHILNILKKYLKSNIQEIYGLEIHSQVKRDKVLHFTNKNDGFTLLIIEDLRVKNIIEVIDFLKCLPTNRRILVIVVFNIQYADEHLHFNINWADVNVISDTCKSNGIEYDLLAFREFDINNAKDWLLKQFKRKQIRRELQDEIIDTILVNHNVKNKGLKGLASKIVLELDKLNDF